MSAAIKLAYNALHIMRAVVATTLGAFTGDHIGFLAGRVFEPRLGATKLIRRLGQDNWTRAGDDVARRFWVVIVARLMPEMGALVSAAGSSLIRYPRFAAVLWTTLWVVGGAITVRALLDVVDRCTVPSLLAAALALTVVVRLWKKRVMS
ncbi:DedA family protein [Spirillospora sp. CA-253888]